MHVEIFTLCDYARGEPTGKLYIVGAFDHLVAAQMPLALMCAIAVRLRFGADEQGPKTIALSFMDSDGEKVIPDLSVQTVVEIPPGENTTTGNVVVMLPQVSLNRIGEYSIDLMINARSEASIPLYVKRPTSQPPSYTYTAQS